MGLPFDFIKGEGPQIERPINDAADIDWPAGLQPRESLAHVLTAVVQIQRESDGRVPLIGFAGALHARLYGRGVAVTPTTSPRPRR